MREPLGQPLTVDGALVTVRNAPLLVSALGLRGLIVMWSGPLAEVPPGWTLCDGTQGTPDLRDRFIVGARKDYEGVPKSTLTGEPTQSGGSVEHSHSFTSDKTTTSLAVGTDGIYAGAEPTDFRIVSDEFSVKGTTENQDSIAVPYYALAFIMKL